MLLSTCTIQRRRGGGVSQLYMHGRDKDPGVPPPSFLKTFLLSNYIILIIFELDNFYSTCVEFAFIESFLL